MKVNFNVPQLDIRGNTIKNGNKDVMLADTLADFLATEQKGNTRKIGVWIDDLVKDGSVYLDEADAKVFEDTIEQSDRMIIMGKKQILSVFDIAKDLFKNKKK